jgi:hypothetical protein
MKLPFWAWVLLVFALLGLWNHRWTPRALKVPEGVIVAPKAPSQTELVGDKTSWSWQGYTLKPLANFAASARLLSVAWYGHGRESELSPVDLGISWGAMSDSRNINALEWSHDSRFLSYRYDDRGPPIAQLVLNREIANLHVIPASQSVLKRIEALPAGSRVFVQGTLVRADASDGWYWQSSLTRDDTGAGACELIWLTDVRQEGQSVKP